MLFFHTIDRLNDDFKAIFGKNEVTLHSLLYKKVRKLYVFNF